MKEEIYYEEWGGTSFRVFSEDGTIKTINPKKDIPPNMTFRKLYIYDENGDVLCETVQ